MCIEFVFQSLTESPNQDGTMKWYDGISVKMRFIFSRIDAALFSHAFSCILTFNIMRRGRNTAMGKSILVVGPNSRTKEKGTCIEFALLDLHSLDNNNNNNNSNNNNNNNSISKNVAVYILHASSF